MDELVLAGATGEHRRVLPARALDEHLLDAADARRVLGERARSTTTRSRSKRSAATAGSTKWSVIVAASVPGRGEKTNV